VSVNNWKMIGEENLVTMFFKYYISRHENVQHILV